jgi:hypothetical protein
MQARAPRRHAVRRAAAAFTMFRIKPGIGSPSV